MAEATSIQVNPEVLTLSYEMTGYKIKLLPNGEKCLWFPDIPIYKKPDIAAHSAKLLEEHKDKAIQTKGGKLIPIESLVPAAEANPRYLEMLVKVSQGKVIGGLREL